MQHIKQQCCVNLPEASGRGADVCLEAERISRVLHVPLPSNVVVVIMCICVDLLDMAKLVPLRARFPFTYGSEQRDVAVYMQIPWVYVLQVSRECFHVVVLQCESMKCRQTLQYLQLWASYDHEVLQIWQIADPL